MHLQTPTLSGILLTVLRPFLRLLIRASVDGDACLPARGPAILAANHNSHLDTLIILGYMRGRRIRPVAARDHFLTSPLADWFYRGVVGVIAIDRHPARDLGILAECHEALRRGDVLLIYPEGTRGVSDNLGPLKGGIARLSEAFPDAPVVPVYLKGTRCPKSRHAALPRRGDCEVRIGPALAWAGSRRVFMSRLRVELELLGSV